MTKQVREEHGHGADDGMRHTHFRVLGDQHDHRPTRAHCASVVKAKQSKRSKAKRAELDQRIANLAIADAIIHAELRCVTEIRSR